MSRESAPEETGWVSKDDAAEVLKISRLGVSWLVFSEDLDEAYSEDQGFGITRDSLQVYRHFLASSTRYERLAHRSLNVLFSPIKLFLKLVGGADVPSPL